MPVSFNNIPSNIRVPLYYVEVDPSKAGLQILRQPILCVGTVIDSKMKGTPGVPVPVGTVAAVENLCGQGSEIALMAHRLFQNNFAQETWILPMAEPGGGNKASGTITINTGPTEAGTYPLYVAGVPVPVAVAASDSSEEVAGAIATAINANKTLPVTASGGGTNTVVTVRCKWAGVNGSDITLSDSYYGKIGGEEMPIGMSVTYSGTGFLTGGTGVPAWDDAITNLGEQEFEYVALPWTDSTTLNAWELEFGFSDTGRWGWARQHFGHIFTGKRGDLQTLIAFGTSRNSALVSPLGIEVASPSPVYEWVAAYASKAARALTNDPARPLQTLSLGGIKAAPLHKRFGFNDLNTLAGVGIATQKIGGDGVPMISRETTMYQLNLYSFSDDAYELVTTLATLARILRNQRQMVTSQWPRHKLVNDGTRIGPGQAVVTPKLIKAALVAQYSRDEYNGLVEDTQNFIKNLIVERDPLDPNRVNVVFPPDLANQLRVFAVLAQFRLQYSRELAVGGV